MTTPHPRDRAMDAVLRRHLTPEGEPSAECLDAETLAAWSDGGLDPASLTAAETHVAGCARCQSLMAAVVRSQPAPPAATPWWGRASLRWLVPLAGAAAATLIWFVAPGPRTDTPTPAAELTQARAEPAPPADRAPAFERRTEPGPDQNAPGPEQKASADFRAAQPATLPLKKSEAPAKGDEPAEAETPAEPGAGARQNLAKQAAPARAAADELRRVDERAAQAEVAPAAPAAAPPSAPAEPPRPAATGATAVGSVGGALRELLAVSAPVTILAPDAVVRWRLGAGGPSGVVERSRDAGAAWERVDTGVQAVLTAGSAPSSLVCWLVGRDGVVLLTTDARTWQRVGGPVDEDLVAVEALDARSATVRTAGGVRFRTTDGGTSWSRVP